MNTTLNGLFNKTTSTIVNTSQRHSVLQSRKSRTSHNKYALKITGVKSNSKTTRNPIKKKTSPKRKQITSRSKGIIKLGTKKWPKRNLSGPKVAPKSNSLNISHCEMGIGRAKLYSTFVNQPKLTKRYKNSIERSTKRTQSRKSSQTKTSKFISELLSKPNAVLFSSKTKIRRSKSPKVLVKTGLLPKKSPDAPKYTLVLDLDETLIHYVEDKTAKARKGSDYYLVRPHAIKFLKDLSAYYELVIFTAGQKGKSLVYLNC
jgi:hypothetical protein